MSMSYILIAGQRSTFQKTEERIENAIKTGRFASWTSSKKMTAFKTLSRYAKRLNVDIKASIVAAMLTAGILLSSAASAQTVEARTDAANPLNLLSVASSGSGYSKPTFADLDNDGDLDLFVGQYYGNHAYFIRTGTSTSPVFGSGNQFSYDGVFYAAPAFFDYDNDGDQDLFTGDSYGNIQLNPYVGGVANTICRPTNAALPAYTNYTIATCPVPGYVNPLNVNGVVVANATPFFVDIDNDGDKDLFIGNSAGNIIYYKNTGSLGSPVFTLQNGAANPFNGVDIGDQSAPAFADIDGDGDKDGLIGNLVGTLKYYKNTGTVSSPAFTLQTGGNDIFAGIDVGSNSAPTFTNLDGDANLDLIIGRADGGFSYYEIINSVLPIDWIDFSANQKNNTVQLDWQMNAGVNAVDYIIQHSTDARNWVNIGELNASANSAQANSYNYTHNNPVNGTNYYRLLQNTVDGKINQSEVRVVNFKGTIDQNFILINSVAQNGVINIHTYGNTELKLYNNQGQLLQTFSAKSGLQQLKMNSTAKGIYYLRSLNKTERFFIQ